MRKTEKIFVGILIGLVLINFGNSLAAGEKNSTFPEITIKGKVVFVDKKEGGYAIYTRNIDGSNLKRITHLSLARATKAPGEPYKEKSPIIIPDGRPVWLPNGKIAFIGAMPKPGSEPLTIPVPGGFLDTGILAQRYLFVMNSDGSDLQPILQLEEQSPMTYSDPPRPSCWSFDGEMFVFYDCEKRKSERLFGLCVFDLSTRKSRLIVPTNIERKIPDGIYHSAVLIPRPDGEKVQVYSSSPNFSLLDITRILWSPDSKKILIFGGDGGNIWIINADGTNLHPITQGGGCNDVYWWPDGKITFQRERENWTMNPDGTNQRIITEGYNVLGDTKKIRLFLRKPIESSFYYHPEFQGQEMFTDLAIHYFRLSLDKQKILFYLKENYWVKKIEGDEYYRVKNINEDIIRIIEDKVKGNIIWE